MKVFPQKYPIDPDRPYHLEHNPIETGMDLRDYFAAKAMAHQKWEAGYDDRFFDARAKACYQMADAMMKAREK